MLSTLFDPKGIAVICNSQNVTELEFVQQLLASKKNKNIAIVDATCNEIRSTACLRDPRDAGFAIDVAVVTSYQANTQKKVEQALLAGAKIVVLLYESTQTTEEIRSVCHSRAARVIGPNSLGFADFQHGPICTLLDIKPTSGTIGLLAQSKAISHAILTKLGERPLGVSKTICLGDKIDLNEIDCMQVFQDDDQTQVVLIAIESIEQGKDFIRRAETLAQKKPVVFYTAHQSGHLDDRIGSFNAGLAYGSTFRRAGIIRARTLQLLVESAEGLAKNPLPQSRNVHLIGNASAGLCISEENLARLGFSTNRELISRSKSGMGALGEAISRALTNETCATVMVVIMPDVEAAPIQYAHEINQSVSLPVPKPLLCVFLGGQSATVACRECRRQGLSAFENPEHAITSLNALHTYAQKRGKPDRILTRFPVNRRRVERILRRCQRQRRVRIDPFLTGEILDAYAFRLPENRAVYDPTEAEEEATRLGFPVNLRILSPDIDYMQSAELIRHNLTHSQMVRDAIDLLQVRLQRLQPNAKIDGFVIEKSWVPGLDVVIGMMRDPQFGPLLMFGLGGISVEVMRDVAFHLAPVGASDAMQMLRSTRSWRLLEKHQQNNQLDPRSIAEGLQRISQLATDFDQISELEINPLIVYPPPDTPLVANARLAIQLPKG